MISRLNHIYFFSIIFSFSVCGQHTNISFGHSINYGYKPAVHSHEISYTNPSEPVFPKLIDYFELKNLSDSTNNTYIWTDKRVKRLGLRKLDIKIIYVKYEYKKPLSGIKIMENYEVFITHNDRQYLKKLKFWNILRLRRIFKKYDEKETYYN